MYNIEDCWPYIHIGLKVSDLPIKNGWINFNVQKTDIKKVYYDPFKWIEDLVNKEAI